MRSESGYFGKAQLRPSAKAEVWYATKFIDEGGTWAPNPDTVGASSLVGATLTLKCYEEMIKEYANGSLIDLGCGNAPLFAIYAPFVDEVTWADWTQTQHDEIKKDLLADLNQPLPIRPSTYDTVLITDVMEHLIYPDAAVKEINRILRPGGVALIGVPFMYWLHEQPYDFHRFTRFKLVRMAADVGMEVVDLRETGGGPDIILDLFMKMMFGRVDGLVRKSVALSLVKAYLAMRRTWPLRRLIKKWSSRFPLGYVAVFRKPKP